MKELKHIKTYNTFINEAFDLQKYFDTQKIIKDIQQLASEFVEEQLDETEVPRDLATKKDNLVLWVAKSFKKELLDNSDNEEFKAYVKGSDEKDTSLKDKMFDIFNTEYREGYYAIFDYFLSTVRRSKVNIITSSYGEMYEEQQEWHDNLEVNPVDIVDETGVIVKTFSDGYYWIDIQTNNSRDEANGMGHCGKTNADTMLSLRDSNKQRHITMAVDYLDKENFTYKAIRQCKGKQNSKPVPKYHKYIVDMLLDDRMDSVVISNNEYSADRDFHLYDIENKNLLIKLMSNKEHLYKRLPLLFFEKNNNIDVVLEAFPEILENPSVLDIIYLKIKNKISEDAAYDDFENHRGVTYYFDDKDMKINSIDVDSLAKAVKHKEIANISELKKHFKTLKVYELRPDFVARYFDSKKAFFTQVSLAESIFLYRHNFISTVDKDETIEIGDDFYKVDEMGVDADATIYKIYVLGEKYNWTQLTFEDVDELENEGILKDIISTFPVYLETEDPEDVRILHENGYVNEETYNTVLEAYEEYLDNNPRKKAFLEHFVAAGEIINSKSEIYNITLIYDEVEMEHPDVEGVFLVLSDGEAEDRALEYVKDTIEECGAPEGLVEDYVDNAAILDFIKEDFNEIVRDDPESYDVVKTIKPEAEEQLDETRERLEQIEESITELNDKLSEEDDDDIIAAIEAEIESLEITKEELEEQIEELEDETNDEYYEYTDESIDARIEELTDEYADCPLDRLKEFLGSEEELLKYLKDNYWIDMDEMAEYIVRVDGRGVQLAGYDHEEIEVGDYFIYRTN
jgi:hypothetical protein